MKISMSVWQRADNKKPAVMSTAAMSKMVLWLIRFSKAPDMTMPMHTVTHEMVKMSDVCERCQPNSVSSGSMNRDHA